MTMLSTRKIFVQIPGYKKYWNRLGSSSKFLLFMFISIGVANIRTIREGLRNSKLHERRLDWIEKEVMDLKNTDYEFLDKEEPPTSLEPRVQIDLFREEFMRKYTRFS